MVGIHIFFYHLHAYFFFLNNTQRNWRMQYINIPSLWKALPFIVMVKTPCAEIRRAFYVLTENMEISVAKKDTVISYNKCSHQAYFVWTLMLPSVSKVQHILQLEYQFFLGPPMLHSKILKDK